MATFLSPAAFWRLRRVEFACLLVGSLGLMAPLARAQAQTVQLKLDHVAVGNTSTVVSHTEVIGSSSFTGTVTARNTSGTGTTTTTVVLNTPSGTFSLTSNPSNQGFVALSPKPIFQGTLEGGAQLDIDTGIAVAGFCNDIRAALSKDYVFLRTDYVFLSIYGRALSAAEIQGIFNAGSGGKCK